MNTLLSLVKRNCKLFFKDKVMFFTSLITPAVLLVLYVTFLADVYRNNILSALPEGVVLEDPLVGAVVGGQLVSSLFSVICVTVAFCANFLIVQDRIVGVRKDFLITPVSRPVLALSYFVATFLSTVIVCLFALALSLCYLAAAGWTLSFADVLCALADIFLLVLFGTALSGFIHSFLRTQGQISAVGTIVSSGYGFICGAYMPISFFGAGLQKVLSFLPGTYATSLFRNAFLRGAFEKLSESGISAQTVESLKQMTDCEIFFFGNAVPRWGMYLILAGAALLFTAAYLLLHFLLNRKKGG